MEKPKLIAKQYLKSHPDKYIMVIYEFGEPIYNVPLKGFKIQVTTDRNAAELWSELDNTPIKLKYHMTSTSYNGLEFEKLTSIETENVRHSSAG